MVSQRYRFDRTYAGLKTEETVETDDVMSNELTDYSLIRRVKLPINIYSLAIAATVDPACGVLHQVMILMHMCLSVAIQGVLTWSIYGISRETEGPDVCQCTDHIQWICICVFCMTIWQELAVTFDMLEFLYVMKSDDGDKKGRLCGDTLNGEVNWSSLSEAHIVGSAEGKEEEWNLCCGSKVWQSNEADLYTRQQTGFKLGDVTRCRKIALAVYVVMPKLISEIALLVAGSYYVAVSKDDEAVVTSVVAVTFICLIDEQFLVSILPTKMKISLELTQPVEYHPETCFEAAWVRLRTSLRMVVDPLVVIIFTHEVFNRVLKNSGCVNDRWE